MYTSIRSLFLFQTTDLVKARFPTAAVGIASHHTANEISILTADDSTVMVEFDLSSKSGLVKTVFLDVLMDQLWGNLEAHSQEWDSALAIGKRDKGDFSLPPRYGLMVQGKGFFACNAWPVRYGPPEGFSGELSIALVTVVEAFQVGRLPLQVGASEELLGPKAVFTHSEARCGAYLFGTADRNR